jgi:formate hydrogenlyase subunit 3/multisubunit Na+/H+ antiporter MnhD subunit
MEVQNMITKYLDSDSRNEIKLYLVLVPILTLLFGLGLGVIIGASGELSSTALALLLLKTASIPLIFMGYLVHKVFQKLDVI